MKVEKLISMSNQIATFFRSYPDDVATAGIKQHLVAFWTPTMVSLLEDRLQDDAAGSDPLVVRAMRRSAPEDSVIDRAVSPVRESGVMASDAG